MLKKICSAVLAALLLQAVAVPAFAGTKSEKESARRAEKVRAQLAKLGAGAEARVKLELRDKTKLEGFISEAGADAFTVTDAAGKTTSVDYSQVKKARGHNLSTGAKIAIGAGIGAAVVLLILYTIYLSNES